MRARAYGTPAEIKARFSAAEPRRASLYVAIRKIVAA